MQLSLSIYYTHTHRAERHCSLAIKHINVKLYKTMTGKEGSLKGDYREILGWEMDKLNVIFVLCIPLEDGQYRLINLLKSLTLRTLRSL